MKLQWLLPLLLVLTIGINFIDIKNTPTRLTNSQNISKPSKVKAASLLLTDTAQKMDEPNALSTTHNKPYGAIVSSGPRNKHEIAMTFDDAPDSTFTPKILDILKNKGVKATFFVVGWRVEAYPDVVRRIVMDGHVIGNHTYSHANLPKLNDKEFHEQIIVTDRLIGNYTGYTPTLVRPPYGEVTNKQVQWLLSKHKKVVNWNVDSLDWKGLNADQVTKNVLTHVHPGSIILQHSGTGTGGDLSGTVNALPKIIDELRNEGFKFVTLPELLDSSSK